MNKQQIIQEEVARVRKVILAESGEHWINIDTATEEQLEDRYQYLENMRDANPENEDGRQNELARIREKLGIPEPIKKDVYGDPAWPSKKQEQSIPLNKVKQVTEQFLLEDKSFGFRFYKEGFQSPKDIAQMLEDALQALKKGKTHGEGWSVFKVGSEFHSGGHSGH